MQYFCETIAREVLGQKTRLYFKFVDLEKAFERVPQDVVGNAQVRC